MPLAFTRAVRTVSTFVISTSRTIRSLPITQKALPPETIDYSMVDLRIGTQLTITMEGMEDTVLLLRGVQSDEIGDQLQLSAQPSEWVDGILHDRGGAAPMGETIIGTDGPDTLEGTKAADVIEGRDGADVINGNGGNDIIRPGADAFEGPRTQFNQTNGFDSVNGGAGDDTIILGGSDVRADGGDGDDLIIGAADGLVTLSGGDGDDTIIGGIGDSVLQQGTGAVLTDSELRGGAGADTIVMGQNNVATGGEGADTFVLDEASQSGNPLLVKITDFDRNEDVLLIGYPDGTTPPNAEDLRYQFRAEYFRNTLVSTSQLVGVEGEDGSIDDLARFDGLGGAPGPVSPFNAILDYPPSTTLIPADQVVFMTYSEIAALGQVAA